MLNNSVISTKPNKLALTMQNSWVNYGAPYTDAIYYKNEMNDVTVEASLKNGTVAQGTIITNLPVGCRPLTQLIRIIYTNGTAAYVEIAANGNVLAGIGISGTFLNLSFVFRAEQ